MLRRATVDQPTTSGGTAVRLPRRKLSGEATFYDNGTTAMRLPGGTLVRICGPGGCIVRTVTDYGPQALGPGARRPVPAGLLPDLRLPVVVGHDLGDRLRLLSRGLAWRARLGATL